MLEPPVFRRRELWADALRTVLDGSWSLHVAAGGRVSALVEPPEGFPTQ